MTFEQGRNKFINRAKQGLPKKQNILEDGSDFGNCLVKAGAMLQKNSTGVLLDKDPSAFKQQLSKSLKLHLDYPAIIDEAVQSISKHINDENILKAFLAPVFLNDDKENTTTTFGLIGLNNSFLKILLNIEVLQHKLMILLLDKIVKLGKQNKQNNESLCLSILKQFCWLDVISEPEELVQKLFESIGACPQGVQQGIIMSLPEIVNDVQHSTVARSLINLTISDPPLLLTTIDALDNLNLPDDCLQEIKQSVMDMLVSAEIEELPVVLKFLFQHVTNDDAIQVVKKIRKNIKLTCDMSARPTSTPLKRAVNKKEAIRGAFALIIETLKLLLFHKAVSNAWMKSIEDVNDTDDIQSIDIFLLLILHNSDELKKQVENLLRNKVVSGVVTSLNMSEVFSIRPEIVEDFFKSVTQLAELFLKSSYQVVVQFACSLFKLSFAKLSSFCQQEIVGSLVTHVGCGCPSVVDLTMDILIQLVDEHLEKMVPYAALINGILDYLDNLDLIQVKKLYQVLGRLAFCSKHGSEMQDGLNIIITKQLSSHVLRYQQIGVVGGLMVALNLSLACCENEQDMTISQSKQMKRMSDNDNNIQQIRNMIELIQSNAQKSPHLMSLFFEELAILIKRKLINKEVEKWIADKIEEDFQVDFVADLEKGCTTNEGLCKPGEMVWKVQFVLDAVEPDDDDFALNVAPLVATETNPWSGSNSAARSSLWCLSSCFRLLHTCQSSLKKNNLEDIDALLGCGIKLPLTFPMTGVQLEATNDKERIVRLHCAFVVINWFRELLNGFSNQEREHMRSKVIIRLHSIVALHCLIERMLLDYPNYSPPPNIYSSDPDDKRVTLVLLPKKSRAIKAPTGKSTKPNRGRKRPRKTSGGDDENNVSNEDLTANLEVTINSTAGPTTSVKTSSNNSNKTINQQLLNSYFRELDMDVFKILSFTKLNCTGVDDEFCEMKLKLDGSALTFLLDDLHLKLSHSLQKNSQKRKPFFKTKSESKSVGFNNLNLIGPLEVANKVCSLIPHLCRYLESLSAYFQMTADKQNETLNCFELDDNKSLTRCVALIIQVLVTYFSWSDLQSNRKLLKESVAHISNRICTKTIKLTDQIQKAFDYMEKFGKCIQDITSAVHLCKLLSCMTALSGCQELKIKTGEVALGFLKQKWREEEKKADANMAVAILLNTCFKHTSDIQTLLELLINSAIHEFIQSEDWSQTFPTLNKDTLPVYYKLLLFYLTEDVKTIKQGNMQTTQDENVDKMSRWDASVKLLKELIDLIKTYDSRSNISSALKHGRKFVDLFIRQGIPILDLLLVTHRDQVQAIFKTLQLSTRALHHLCSHSKIKKDISLTNQVPQLKCSLESLIHRVKDMLNKNKCVAAFWLGNLKNRDLKGVEILSQTIQGSDDDDDGDDDGNKIATNDKRGGASEIYELLLGDVPEDVEQEMDDSNCHSDGKVEDSGDDNDGMY